MVTAEHKTNRYGYPYTYYHCSWRRPDYRCYQPSVQEGKLEGYLGEFLYEIAPPDSLHEWTLARLDLMTKDTAAVEKAKRHSLEQALQAVRQQRENLTTLRIRDLLSDEEFVRQRSVLEREELKLVQQQEAGIVENWFEPAQLALSFNKTAAAWFAAGDPKTKRTIIEMTGSNLVLKDRELRIDARKPFRRWSGRPTYSQMCAYLRDVRTFVSGPEGAQFTAALRELSSHCNSPPPQDLPPATAS